MDDRTATEKAQLPEQNPYQKGDMDRLWRGLFGVTIVAAVALAIFGVVLLGFAQIIPAFLVFGVAIMVALMAGPMLWKKMSHGKVKYEREMR